MTSAGRLVLLIPMLAAAAHAQQPADGSNRLPEPQNPAPLDAAGRSADEWEHARAEFLEARAEFARATAAALTSEELTRWVSGFSTRGRLRRVERELAAAHASLAEAEQTGAGGEDRLRRLQTAIIELEAEAARLRDPAALRDAAAGGITLPDRDTVRRRIEQEMAEESLRTADLLDTTELERRARRLRRLTGLAGLAGGVRNRRAVSQQVGSAPQPPRSPAESARDLSRTVPSSTGPSAGGSGDLIVPAGGTLDLPEASLGPGTTEPPTLAGREPPSRRSVEPADGTDGAAAE